MKKLILVLLAMVSVGCGARVDMISDKIKDRLDALVGKLDAKKKEIENQIG